MNALQKGSVLGLCMMMVAICMLISIVYGKVEVPLSKVWEAFTHFNGSDNHHLIIQTTRLPRSLIACLVGGSLGIAGLMLQTVTRNPLSSPGTLGINSGASLFIVIGITLFTDLSFSQMMGLSFMGSMVTFVLVYILGSMGSQTVSPLRLILAGSTLAALFSSLTHGLLSMNEKQLDEILFWMTGSIAGRRLEVIYPVLPLLIIGWLGSFFLAKQLNVLAMGDGISKSLGQRTQYIQLSAMGCSILLAGGAVAVAGPIVFIGFITPHIARLLIGNDHRWLLPYTAVLGMLLLLVADIIGRFVLQVEELPVGVTTAIIGAPFFIYLVCRK